MVIDIRTRQFGRLFSEGREPSPPLSVSERRERRETMFTETMTARARRHARNIASACWQGPRNLIGAADCLIRDRAIGVAGLPDPTAASTHPEGLCGLIANPTPELLMEGFARGLQATETFGPLTWHAPARRMVADPAELAIAPRVKNLLALGPARITLDRDFDGVVLACKARANLSPRLMHLYAALHDMGFAHSFEVRGALGQLVAGGFGVALGRIFVSVATFGVSADQIALGVCIFNRHLARMDFALHDVLATSNAQSLGFAAMSRDAYFSALIANSRFGRLGRWQVRPELCGAETPAPIVRNAA